MPASGPASFRPRRSLVDPIVEAVELERDDDMPLADRRQEIRPLEQPRAHWWRCSHGRFRAAQGPRPGRPPARDAPAARRRRGSARRSAAPPGSGRRGCGGTRPAHVPRPAGVDQADRAAQVAARGDLDDRHAQVLLVAVAQSAAFRAREVGSAAMLRGIHAGLT